MLKKLILLFLLSIILISCTLTKEVYKRNLKYTHYFEQNKHRKTKLNKEPKAIPEGFFIYQEDKRFIYKKDEFEKSEYFLPLNKQHLFLYIVKENSKKNLNLLIWQKKKTWLFFKRIVLKDDKGNHLEFKVNSEDKVEKVIGRFIYEEVNLSLGFSERQVLEKMKNSSYIKVDFIGRKNKSYAFGGETMELLRMVLDFYNKKF